MKMVFSRGAAFAVLTTALVVSAVSSARADIKDYEFRLVQAEVKKGDDAIVTARLIDKRTGKAVPGAVIFTTRLDMAPEGMSTMTAPVEALPSTEPGVYRFKVGLTMAGGWRLSLAAKIQGEIGTVENELTFKAEP